MGQFSFLDCVTGEQIIDNIPKKVYLLVPKEFAGEYGPRILEEEYDGYGNFGGHDVYDLIADWNKEMIPEILRRAKKGSWHNTITDEDCEIMKAFLDGMPIENMKTRIGFRAEKRWIGILMACYDEDNAALEYPVKVTYSPTAVYEQCAPSPSDPNQGWPPEDDDDY